MNNKTPILYFDNNATSLIKNKIPQIIEQDQLIYNIRSNPNLDLGIIQDTIKSKLNLRFNLPPNISNVVFTNSATEAINVACYNFINHSDKVLNFYDFYIHNSLYSQINLNYDSYITKYEKFPNLNNYNIFNFYLTPVTSIVINNNFNSNKKYYDYFYNILTNIKDYQNVNIIIDSSQEIEWDKNYSILTKFIENLNQKINYNLFICFGFHKKLALYPNSGILIHYTNNKNKTLKRIIKGGTGTEDTNTYDLSIFPSGTFDIKPFLIFDYYLTSSVYTQRELLEDYFIRSFGKNIYDIKLYILDFLRNLFDSKYNLNKYNTSIINDPLHDVLFTSSVLTPDEVHNILNDGYLQQFKAPFIARTGFMCSNFLYERSKNNQIKTISTEGYLRIT